MLLTVVLCFFLSQTPGQKGTGYRSYLNRAGPQALGTKDVPEVIKHLALVCKRYVVLSQ